MSWTFALDIKRTGMPWRKRDSSTSRPTSRIFSLKLGSNPNAKTAQAHVVAYLTKIDPGALFRKITEDHGYLPDDIAFVWFSPLCKTNSSMQRTNESRDTAKIPVTWHRRHGGETREGSPCNLARKHAILVLKWTHWLTS